MDVADVTLTNRKVLHPLPRAYICTIRKIIKTVRFFRKNGTLWEYPIFTLYVCHQIISSQVMHTWVPDHSSWVDLWLRGTIFFLCCTVHRLLKLVICEYDHERQVVNPPVISNQILHH